MKKFILCYLIIITGINFSTGWANTSYNLSLREDIRKIANGQFTKPQLRKCIPPSRNNDPGIEKQVTTAILERYGELKRGDIIRVIISEPGWRILRNEFTGFVTGRYIFVYILVNSETDDELYLLRINVMQNNSFMGWIFDPAYVRYILSVDRIKKKDIDTVCEK
ncbi:MAG TPA: hypothetical protein PK358_11345 [Spirochaetota bacterium]|nr:hypothetical protein [Spirochaetota bacterium]HPJ35423.1 hypothetical protein [Spirochaetota bacterium]